MIKLIIISILLMIVTSFTHGQSFTRATASVSAEIITPIGVERNGELVINNYRPNNINSTIELKQNVLFVNGEIAAGESDHNINIPSFHISSGKSSYSISINYDSVIAGNNNTKESILIEELIVLPLIEKCRSEKNSKGFSLGAKLHLGSAQAPGKYTSPSPCRIVIHFN